jgi:hypothetical protein
VTDAERRSGVARENAMAWAMQTAVSGEDPLAILARAQLYEEYISAFIATALKGAATGVEFDRR